MYPNYFLCFILLFQNRRKLAVKTFTITNEFFTEQNADYKQLNAHLKNVNNIGIYLFSK